MSKRSRIVRRRMRAHENRGFAELVITKGDHFGTPVNNRGPSPFMKAWRERQFTMSQVVASTPLSLSLPIVGTFPDGAPGQPVIMEEVEIKSASVDGMNFIYHPRNPNP